jgi:hypothetical protein
MKIKRDKNLKNFKVSYIQKMNDKKVYLIWNIKKLIFERDIK